ncbi:uncharacterized protein LOC126856048 isoform X3 [Cataglyphis hispanica]|uniref:uncharacterized protein LOC126856048 isoform X3 n=1 Tax=Cataglyphis hispanica TaxID=1086592 RepID=UPI00217F4110|nr:uncharacterized protein LOC126856048 isoform X3 [Cataglyphis hispanica]
MSEVSINIMSENTFEEGNNLFRDYKNENFDDSDLQSRLYAEIYYESNVGDEPNTSNISTTIQLTNMDAELNFEPENMQQQSEDKQPLEFESANKSPKTKKISKEHCKQNTLLPNESSVIDNDISRVQNLTDTINPASVEIQTSIDKLSDQEMNPIIHYKDNINNDNLENSSVEKEKSFAKKHKSPNTKSKHRENLLKDQTALSNDMIHSKYNVMSKSAKQEIFLDKLKNDKQTSDSSDSEESIFEVPVPPKPKPPLINLHDSDEENDTNSKMDELISKNVSSKITGESSNHQGTSVKNKNTNKSLHNKDTTVNSRNNHTRTQEIREDIVLNCTIVQKGAKSICEIKKSSKSAKLNKNQNVSIEDINQNSTKQLQTTSKERTANLEQFMIPEIYSYNYIHEVQQKINKNNIISTPDRYNLRSAERNNILDATASCSSNDTAIDRKRQNDSRMENPKQKRQCTVQQNYQYVMQQSSSGENRKSESRNEFFKTMSESLRNHYYNSSRSQENFDVDELQRSMSKDPQMWRIMDADLMPCPSSRHRNRFWYNRCTHCHQDGHQRYDCPVPRKTPCCYICGNKGHIESRCPQKMCLTCGHESTQCPDLWRRYHQTTDMSGPPQNPGNIMKPPGLLHCCNCTKRGHESSTCNAYRWSQHFQTPAAVSSYTDGPMYTSFSSSDFQISLSSKATSSSSIPVEEYSKSFSSADTLSSNAKTNEMPIPQGSLCNLEGNLESSINKIHQPEDKQKKYRQNGINEIEFTTILFACGKFHDKNNKDAQMISRNLSVLRKKDLSSDGRKTIASFPKRKIIPLFLKTLVEKTIEFEIKIGHTRHQYQDVILQIIAMKGHIELLCDLLFHWINLPDNEKDYGVDVTLPMNPTKMFNLLSSRMPQLTKMSFTCYNDHIQGINDPRWIFQSIKDHKKQLEKHNGSFRQYSRLRTKMWRLQVKLLMIFNTEPKPNHYISQFKNAMKQLESVKRDRMIENLDAVIYLQLTLLYNRLFVPHTPVTLFKMLARIEKHSEMMRKNMNCSPQILQELENNGICEQENLASHFNVNSSLTVTFSTSQNTHSAENVSAIGVQQNTSDELLVERRDDISPIINDTVDRNDNEIMILEDSVTEDAQNDISSNPEIFNSVEPILIPTEPVLIPTEPVLIPEDRNDDQPLTSGLNESSVNKWIQNKYTCRYKNSKKVEQWKKKQEKLERKRNIAIANMYPNASKLIKEARALELPHMMKAANELERKLNSQTITLKHVESMKKMIKLEKKYRQTVTTFWKDLKT